MGFNFRELFAPTAFYITTLSDTKVVCTFSPTFEQIFPSESVKFPTLYHLMYTETFSHEQFNYSVRLVPNMQTTTTNINNTARVVPNMRITITFHFQQRLQRSIWVVPNKQTATMHNKHIVLWTVRNVQTT